jgi:hypothetical protein
MRARSSRLEVSFVTGQTSKFAALNGHERLGRLHFHRGCQTGHFCESIVNGPFALLSASVHTSAHCVFAHSTIAASR